jgi:lysophospholipase L1-like esterase/pimeloyl-ACP methyl ester carboxylesterase
MKKLFLFLFLVQNTYSQIIAWDDTKSKNWHPDFKKVEIISSADKTPQPSVIYKSTLPKQPLIVSLHSWSGDFMQADSISWEVRERNWNFIHPHFRGPNWLPDACGSDLVVKDIEDAINYAVQNLDIDKSEVHIVGASGGGHAAMLCYLKLKYPIKSVSAWVGISNLVDWYYESNSRGQRYGKDILKATGDTTKLNIEEAKRRSPLFVPMLHKDPNRQLFLYAGVHDGYTGSVPITHTLNFYNRIIKDWGASKNDLITDEDKLELVVKRNYTLKDQNLNLGNRKVHFFRKFKQISVNIFEGKHEQVVKSVLALMPMQQRIVNKKWNILCIGDSNGENREGWVTQLKFELPYSKIINTCKSGNTIGFDNNGNADLNELKNLNKHIEKYKTESQTNSPDFVIVQLGTNDTKTIFADKQNEVVENFDKLLQNITQNLPKSKIIVISPPPIGDELSKTNAEKYIGSQQRIVALQAKIKAISEQKKAVFIDSYSKLIQNTKENFYDGIHFTALGAKIVARAVGKEFRND